MLGILNNVATVDDFTNAFAHIAQKTLDVFRLRMVWSANISMLDGTSGYLASGNSPLLLGDSRLRYLYSEHDYAANNNAEPTNKILIFLPDPTDLTRFMLYDPFPLGAIVTNTVGYLDKTVVPAKTFYVSASAAGITNASAIKPMFLIKRTQSTNKREYLGSNGKPYDVNQPLANLSKIRAWNFNVVVKTDSSGYIINVTGLPTGTTQTTTYTLDTSDTNILDLNSSIELTYNDQDGTAQVIEYVPIQTLTADSEIINASDNEYKILYHMSPLPATYNAGSSLMGWNNAGNALKLFKTYYSVLSDGSSNGLKLGFFNLLPITKERTESAISYFMLLTSTNSHYITAGPSSVSFVQAPLNLTDISSARSTQAEGANTYLGSLYGYGAWSFVNITSSTGSDTFYLMYTPPYSMTNVRTATSTGLITSSTAEATTASYYLTFSTASTTYSAASGTGSTPPANAVLFTCANCSLNTDGVCTV
jgi:hypothetical protein